MTYPGIVVTVSWDAYFTNLAAFAGVVFAITLAARTIREQDRGGETAERKTVRLWDSPSVTYELAAAGLFAILFASPSPWLAEIFGTLVALIGLALYVLYVRSFADLRKKPDGKFGALDHLWLWLTLVPASAFVAASIGLWVHQTALWGAFDLTQWFALAVTWLVFSGTSQALLWYLNTAE